MERIRAVFNWSGGKDSAHALWRAMRSGDYEIVALLTTVDGSTRRSTMHGIPAASGFRCTASIWLRTAIWRITERRCRVPWRISGRGA